MSDVEKPPTVYDEFDPSMIAEYENANGSGASISVIQTVAPVDPEGDIEILSREEPIIGDVLEDHDDVREALGDEPDDEPEETSEDLDLVDLLGEWVIGLITLAVGVAIGFLIIYSGSRVGFTGPMIGGAVVAGLTLAFGIGRLARVLVGTDLANKTSGK